MARKGKLVEGPKTTTAAAVPCEPVPSHLICSLYSHSRLSSRAGVNKVSQCTQHPSTWQVTRQHSSQQTSRHARRQPSQTKPVATCRRRLVRKPHNRGCPISRQRRLSRVLCRPRSQLLMPRVPSLYRSRRSSLECGLRAGVFSGLACLKGMTAHRALAKAGDPRPPDLNRAAKAIKATSLDSRISQNAVARQNLRFQSCLVRLMVHPKGRTRRGQPEAS